MEIVWDSATECSWLDAGGNAGADSARGVEYRQDLFDELITQTGTLSIIPIGYFEYVGFRLRPRNDLPVHDFDRDRK